MNPRNAAAAVLLVMASAAQAQMLDITHTSTLSFGSSGSDSPGLDGALITLSFSVDTSGAWSSPGTQIGPLAAQLTISGSSVPANDQTVGLDVYYFVNTGSGTDAVIAGGPSAESISVNLAGGAVLRGSLAFEGQAGSAGVVAGDGIESAHFARGALTSFDALRWGVPGVGDYFNRNQSATVVPAPATAAMLGLGGLFAARRRR